MNTTVMKKTALRDELGKPYLAQLSTFLQAERRSVAVVPAEGPCVDHAWVLALIKGSCFSVSFSASDHRCTQHKSKVIQEKWFS
jgi:hypothetical protein